MLFVAEFELIACGGVYAYVMQSVRNHVKLIPRNMSFIPVLPNSDLKRDYICLTHLSIANWIRFTELSAIR